MEQDEAPVCCGGRMVRSKVSCHWECEVCGCLISDIFSAEHPEIMRQLRRLPEQDQEVGDGP